MHTEREREVLPHMSFAVMNIRLSVNLHIVCSLHEVILSYFVTNMSHIWKLQQQYPYWLCADGVWRFSQEAARCFSVCWSLGIIYEDFEVMVRNKTFSQTCCFLCGL